MLIIRYSIFMATFLIISSAHAQSFSFSVKKPYEDQSRSSHEKDLKTNPKPPIKAQNNHRLPSSEPNSIEPKKVEKHRIFVFDLKK